MGGHYVSRAWTVVVLSALAMSAIGMGALAGPGIPGPDGTVNACFKLAGGDNAGAMRAVADPTECKSNEGALSFNQHGQPGAPGPQGPQGPQGPAGPAGPSDTTAIAAEAATRQAADGQLQANINNEMAARSQGDASTLASAEAYADLQVANEAAARQAADTQLQANINNEITARSQGDASTLASAKLYTDQHFTAGTGIAISPSGLISNTGAITVNTGAGLAGGGTIQPGGSLTISNTGVRSITAGSGLIATASTGDVSLQVQISADQIVSGTIETTRLPPIDASHLSGVGSQPHQVLTSTGTGVDWQDAPAFALPFSGTTTVANGTAFIVTNLGSNGGAIAGSGTPGVKGLGAGLSADGVVGQGAGPGDGVMGTGGGNNGIGVVGKGGGLSGLGVYGQGGSADGDGVAGVGGPGGGSGVVGQGGSHGSGVVGFGSAGGAGVVGIGNGGLAGRFIGDVAISGTLSKGAGSFKIDNPLDPANEYLSHSFVESPDMMNIYNGNVTTDSGGLATVELPGYFEALNRDFRYQLTVIGTFAQAIVAEEISGNRFVIATDKPGVKVSWQVTGIRQDPYANAHRITVIEEKAATDRGTYLHPELYGYSGR